MDSLVVTHPFHPLYGERLEIMRVLRRGASRLYVCASGALGSVGLPENATDRGPEPAGKPLTCEVLADMEALIAELNGEQGVAR